MNESKEEGLKWTIKKSMPHVFSIVLPETKSEVPIGECFGGKGMAEKNAKKIIDAMNTRHQELVGIKLERLTQIIYESKMFHGNRNAMHKLAKAISKTFGTPREISLEEVEGVLFNAFADCYPVDFTNKFSLEQERVIKTQAKAIVKHKEGKNG